MSIWRLSLLLLDPMPNDYYYMDTILSTELGSLSLSTSMAALGDCQLVVVNPVYSNQLAHPNLFLNLSSTVTDTTSLLSANSRLVKIPC